MYLKLLILLVLAAAIIADVAAQEEPPGGMGKGVVSAFVAVVSAGDPGSMPTVTSPKLASLETWETPMLLQMETVKKAKENKRLGLPPIYTGR
ncbi:uncharacterized protein LOC118422409 isoform X2 [Branchiostoma floridae]|uniref:Uncharacterized protein LOC118422409 isoform X2 n=1 Tax=Branchiostoma floridae TaxID=7739 RepID=A0A9J7LMV2_BRAFL|nr:uncharacterized protein LOC118422409 isoform X2 [Branchiostoma floridae]